MWTGCIMPPKRRCPSLSILPPYHLFHAACHVVNSRPSTIPHSSCRRCNWANHSHAITVYHAWSLYAAFSVAARSVCARRAVCCALSGWLLFGGVACNVQLWRPLRLCATCFLVPSLWCVNTVSYLRLRWHDAPVCC